MIGAGSIVILHLIHPTEKLWGVLNQLSSVGVLLRGLNISSFDDWLAQAASGEVPTLGLASMFVPMGRVEKIFLDEQIGSVESYCQRFEKRVGVSVQTFLDLPGDPASTVEPS